MSNKNFYTEVDLSNMRTYQVGVLESSAHRALRQFKDKLLKEYGLSNMEWCLIGIVADSGPNGIRTSDLAELLGTTQGYLTKTTKLLEAKNILHKMANEKDGRSTYIAVTNSFKPQVLEIELALRAQLRKTIYGLLSPDELKQYISIMERLSKID